MCLKGWARDSWQKGSLLTVQISVSYIERGVSHTPVKVNFSPSCGTYRLQSLLDLSIQGAGLDGNDFGGGIRVVSNGGTTLRAEDAVDSEAGRTLASPALGGTVDSQLVLGDDSDEGYTKVNNCFSPGVLPQLTVGRATLTLAVIAVIITSE